LAVRPSTRLAVPREPIVLPSFDIIVVLSWYDVGWDMDWARVMRVRGVDARVEVETLYDGPFHAKHFDVAVERAKELNVPVYTWTGRVFEEVEAFRWAREFIDRMREKRCPLCGRRLKTYRVRVRRRYTEPPALPDYADDLRGYDVSEVREATCFHCNVKYTWWYWEDDWGAVLNWRFRVCVDGRCIEYTKTGPTNEENTFMQYVELLRGLAELGVVRFA
jgi:hypothetical protein